MISPIRMRCSSVTQSSLADEYDDAPGDTRKTPDDIEKIIGKIFQLSLALLGMLKEEPLSDGSQSRLPQQNSAGTQMDTQPQPGAQPRTSLPSATGEQADPAKLGLGGGWTRQNYDHSIHTPYNEPESAHFQADGDSMHFDLNSGNAPFKPGSDTDPRSEYRVKNDYKSGEHLFSADYQVKGSPGNDSTIFQIHRGTGPGFATNMMLRVKDGKLTFYKKAIATVGDRPFNLKVYHNADNSEIKVFVDDILVLETRERERTNSGNYWKFGLYGVDGSAEATVSNVQMFSR